MRKFYLGLIGVCMACGLAAKARASVVYTYVTDQSTYSGSAGSIVPVSIYLQETLTGGSTSLITGNGGLFSAGAAFDATNPGSGEALVQSGTFVANSGFNGIVSPAYNQGTGNAANNLEINENIAVTSPPTAGVALTSSSTVGSTTTDKVLLGTINVKVGSASTSFNLTSLADESWGNGGGGFNGNTLTAVNNIDLDSTNNVPNGGGFTYTGSDANTAGTNFTVTPSAVPEPVSFAVFGVGALGLLIRRQRRCD